jgi:acetyl esterase/lipase
MHMRKVAFVISLAASIAVLAEAQTTRQAEVRVESNVVYGMYSGLALLMDVHYPEATNGYGIIFVPGTGFHAPLAYDAAPLKATPAVAIYAKPLLDIGYTLFVVNYRLAPRFRYPAAVEDVQRAVRYIRHNAGRYGIRADRIGAVGGSAGGYLVDMLGVLEGVGDPEDSDPVNRESARVQCVVSFFGPTDLVRVPPSPVETDFLGMALSVGGQLLPVTSIEYKTYHEASPVYRVNKDSPPFLLIHGEADKVVPIRNSELMEEQLRQAGVPVRLVRAPGLGHGSDFSSAPNLPEYLKEMVRWFDQYLQKP